MNEEFIKLAAFILAGSLSGGLTNTVAIWMLFHPYEPPKLLRRWRLGFFQGAIPKNQPRLAAAIGKTVGDRLLTAEDLTQTFTDETFRATFDDRLAQFLNGVLNTERAALHDLIPERVMPDIEVLLEEGLDKALAQLDDYLESERFAEAMQRRAGDLVEAIKDEPIGSLITSARGAAVESAVEEWLHHAVDSEDFKAAIEDYLDRAARRLLEPGRTFEEILPTGLVGTVEKAIAGYLPLAARRLGRLLEDDTARARFESTLHDLLHRFLKDLKFHQRVVARLVMTEDTVDKVLDTIEAEGAERLSEILRDSAVQEAMGRGINQAIVDFLRRPVTDVLGEPDDPSVIESRTTLADWIVGMARDPGTREFLVEKLHEGLDKAGDRTWGAVLERIPSERISETLVSAARSEALRAALGDGIRKLARDLLDRPIGTPARWLPENGAARIEAALGDPIWAWLETQVPTVVAQIDVSGRVEAKVLSFPVSRMEEIVKNVTHRELKLIVRLGYVLGAVIGVVLFLLEPFLP